MRLTLFALALCGCTDPESTVVDAQRLLDMRRTIDITVEQPPLPPPPASTEKVDTNDASEVYAAVFNAEAVRLKWVGRKDDVLHEVAAAKEKAATTKKKFEKKYRIHFDAGDGWDEANDALWIRRLSGGK
jgi:hypothetical protein